MLSSIAHRLAAPASAARLYSTQLSATAAAAATALPYRVRRNTRGSIPVYSDIRNGGTRYLVLIRNVEGNVDALAQDLKASLWPQGSPEAERMRVEVTPTRHVVLTGGRWKNSVISWLARRGF
ncbi:mitochondrial large subunit ribosomal protein-domain-containing protein [Trametes polyzona]|nr:mitochondrial large subunit ribosomal protein-domain-containing protein [Trametes polyzona]